MRAIYARDVGSTRSRVPKFAWTRILPERSSEVVGSSDIRVLVSFLENDLRGVRASVLPRAGALLLVVGGPLWFFGPAFFSSLIDGSEDWLLVLPAMVPAALFGSGWALLGYALLSEKGERTAHPHSDSPVERKGTGDV